MTHHTLAAWCRRHAAVLAVLLAAPAAGQAAPEATSLQAAAPLLPAQPVVSSPAQATPASPSIPCEPAPPPLEIAEPERDLAEVEAIVNAIKDVTMGGVCKALTAFDAPSVRRHLTPGRS